MQATACGAREVRTLHRSKCLDFEEAMTFARRSIECALVLGPREQLSRQTTGSSVGKMCSDFHVGTKASCQKWIWRGPNGKASCQYGSLSQQRVYVAAAQRSLYMTGEKTAFQSFRYVWTSQMISIDGVFKSLVVILIMRMPVVQHLSGTCYRCII